MALAALRTLLQIGRTGIRLTAALRAHRSGHAVGIRVHGTAIRTAGRGRCHAVGIGIDRTAIRAAADGLSLAVGIRIDRTAIRTAALRLNRTTEAALALRLGLANRLGNSQIDGCVDLGTAHGCHHADQRSNGGLGIQRLQQLSGQLAVGLGHFLLGMLGNLTGHALGQHLADLLAGGRLLRQNLCAGVLAVIPHAGYLAAHHKGVSAAFTACTAGTTYAVHVILYIQRNVIVENGLHAVHIDAAGSYIGSHQHADHAGTEARHDGVALDLAHIAMQAGHGESAALQVGHHVFHTQLGVAEHQRQLGIIAHQQAGQQLALLERTHGNVALVDLLNGHLLRSHLDMHRILQVLLTQRQNRQRHGGGEQRGLAGFRGILQNGLDILAEAHVQHLVGLIQNGHLHAGNIQRAAAHVVHHAAGRTDDDLHTAVQLAKLTLNGRAAVHRQSGNVLVLAQLVQLTGGLQRQLSGRGEHDSLHAAVIGIDHLHQRNAEGGGLAGAGLCLTDHVLAFQHGRNGVALDGRRLLKAHFLNRLAEFLRNIHRKLFQYSKLLLRGRTVRHFHCYHYTQKI